jgi:hypothetical protein
MGIQILRSLLSCKQKRIFLSFCILLSIAPVSISQVRVDTIYLKNGSAAYGKVQKSLSGNFRIQTQDGFLFTFSADEVARYVPATTSAVKENIKTEYKREKGWGFTVQSSIHSGSPDELFILLPSFTATGDYTFNSYHLLSAGTGFEQFEYSLLPIFLQHKVFFSDRSTAPFLYYKAGIMFPLKVDENNTYGNTDYKTGYTFGLGLGFTWPIKKIESFIQLGYKFAHTKYIDSYEIDQYSNVMSNVYIGNYNRIEITWGFKF